jgi:hypothetical protein
MTRAGRATWLWTATLVAAACLRPLQWALPVALAHEQHD